MGDRHLDLTRVARWLDRRGALGWLALLTALCCVPSLFGGAQTEDLGFSFLARQPGAAFDLWGGDLQRSAEQTRHHVRLLRDAGLLPWLSADDFRVVFFRPLSSATHRLDFAMAPSAPALWHLQSVLWYGALCAGAALLYRRLLGPPGAVALAFAFFALAHGHGQAVGWVSNRNALVAGAFACWALLARLRAQERGWASALGAALLLAAGLAAGESALGAVAYLLAIELSQPGWRARRFALPWLLVTVAYGVAYAGGGYGALDSELYLHPLRSPAEWLEAAPARALALLGGLTLGPPSDLWNGASPREQLALALAALAALALTGIGLTRPGVPRARARQLALGTLLSLAPSLSVFPEDRVLLLPSVGGAALLGLLTHAALSSPRRAGRGVGAALLAYALIASPLGFSWRTLGMRRYEARLERARQSLYAGADRGRTLLVLDAPDFYFGALMVSSELARTGQLPPRTLVLTGSLRGALRLTRTSADTLELELAAGLLSEPLNRNYRRRAARPRVGESVQLDGVQITVLATTPAHDPTRLAVRFEPGRSSHAVEAFRWDEGRYVPLALPAPGQALSLHPDTPPAPSPP